MSDSQLIKIRKSFYRYFFDLIFEIIKMISSQKSFINKRVSIQNPDLIKNILSKKQSVILISGHYNNWEWMGAKIAISFDNLFIAVYKPLNSNIFDNLLNNIRTRFNGTVINMEESMRYLIKTKNNCQIIGIIADQNPVVNNGTEWISFFGKEVPVFMGIEKIACKMNYPVIFAEMKKVRKGNYSITFEVLASNPKDLAKGQITKLYFKRLEKQITERPSQWLWSHRRWKHKR